jgi:hypothetical protein
VIGFWLAFNALQLGLATFAFRIDREPLTPLWALPLQQFVYRQLMYLVIIESTTSALVGARAHWRHLERTGDVEIIARPARPAAAEPSRLRPSAIAATDDPQAASASPGQQSQQAASPPVRSRGRSRVRVDT